MSRVFELAIIGAGIVGTMVAHLSRQIVDSGDVLLVDRGFVASGTTGHSPGHCHPHGFDARQRALTDRSLAFFETAAPEFPAGSFLRKQLAGVVAASHAETTVGSYLRGAPVIADAGEIQHKAGELGLSIADDQTIHAGGFTFVAQPNILARYLASRFRSSGGTVWEGLHVNALAEDGSKWRIVFADGQSIRAGRVVVAVGPWVEKGSFTDRFSGLPFRRKKICALHIAAEVTAESPLIYFHDDDSYLMPRTDAGYWLFSFTSPDWDCVVDPTRLVIDERDRAIALSVLAKYRPDFIDRVAGGRVGPDGYSPDFNPGAWLDTSGHLAFAGLGSGYGFRLGPAIAAEALSLLFPGEQIRTERGLG